jgi:predicted Zn-ribbon and HTH transcriptional regulator
LPDREARVPVDSVIMEARPCRKCGYDLKGLRVGGKCPECGEPIRARRKSFGPREGTLSDAPPAYIRALRSGFWIMTAAVLGSLLGSIVSLFAPIIGGALSVLAALSWVGGVWIISNPRPDPFPMLENPILDSARYRLIVRAAACAWPVSVIIGAVAEIAAPVAPAPGTPAAPVSILFGVLIALRVLAGVASYAALIPICIFVGDMAFWMSDDSGGWRLRAAAWAMAIFGTISMLGLGLAGLGFGIGNVLLFGPPFIVFVAQIVFFWSVMGCASLASWVLRYQDQNEGRVERITERLRDRSERGGTVAGSMPCLHCGYELRGLPHGGNCPECGQSYAHLTPMPIRDPAKSPRRDDSPIAIDDTGPTQTIRARDPVFGPRPEPVDDSPIPLAGDDLPEDLQDTPPPPPPPADGDDTIPLADDEPRRP